MKNRWLKAGITTYVMMMLGFAIMFYLFGFTTIWTNYTDKPAIGDDNDISITDPTLINENTLLSMKNILIGTGGLIAVVGATLLVGYLFGVAGTVLQIIFPLLLLLMCNIFIFPVMPGSETHINDVFPITAFMIGFFNLWFILAIIEFIRG